MFVFTDFLEIVALKDRSALKEIVAHFCCHLLLQAGIIRYNVRSFLGDNGIAAKLIW